MMNKLIILLILASGVVNANEYLSYVAVDPCRIVDTRKGDGVIPAGDFRNFKVTGTLGELAGQGGTTDCPNPMSGVKPQAVSAYVLVVPKGITGGVATAYPSDRLPPPVGAGSTVNFDRGQIAGNTTNITLCENCPFDGEFAVLARSTGFDVIVDVQGYFYPMPVSGEGACPASSPVRWVDNGDGTICDNQTGLMWEKKLAADGSDGGNCAAINKDERDVHCVNNFYNLDYFDDVHIDPSPLTANTIFLATLNQEIRNEFLSDEWNNTCFANHCDWRIPRLSELKSIYLEGQDIFPCIDPIFGPTSAMADTHEDGQFITDKYTYVTSTRNITSSDWTQHFTMDFGRGSYFGEGSCGGYVSAGCGEATSCGNWVRAVRNTR